MEYLDILDTSGNKTGEIRSYEQAHKEGLIHKAVHVWIVNKNGDLIIQKRKKDRRAYPSFWDISAAGHVSAGESSLEAARKETSEELGIEIPISEFKYLFTVEEHIILNSGTYINNEFQDVFLVRRDLEVSQINFSKEEVEEVRSISLKGFETWINGDGEPMVPHKEEYRMLKEFINSTN